MKERKYGEERDRVHDFNGDDSPILPLSKSWLLCLEFASGIFIKLSRITPGWVNRQHNTSGKLKCCKNTSFIAHNTSEAIHNTCISGDSILNLWDLWCLFCFVLLLLGSLLFLDRRFNGDSDMQLFLKLVLFITT